jgi:hypothetical protein
MKKGSTTKCNISNGCKSPKGGLTEAGRKKYNRETGSSLKAPTKDKDNPRHKSFCARSQGWDGERGKAARKRWGC